MEEDAALHQMQEAAQAVSNFHGKAKDVPDADAVMAMCKDWGVTADLKLHQAQGVSWLIGRYVQGVNVILGDEVRIPDCLDDMFA
ncbi:hypothetical protein KC19_2G286200 [Ceratodon purpureus]|uniref:Uncharacterized protein n=1 Tax=Ceratodon purpureus TaxID=3225 RepID=A0A8T0J1L3_CERPU|nr:hypothetical protein KC19_2G286200 [Ceratodon purpureus]